MAETKVTPIEIYNPYKFSAYRNAAFTTGNNAFGLVTFDTVEFDTSSSFATATGRFTAPVAGFYQVNCGVGFTSSSGYIVLAFFKNGAEVKRGLELNVATTTDTELCCGTLLQLAATDYVQVYIQAPGANAGATGAIRTYFNGFMMSQT